MVTDVVSRFESSLAALDVDHTRVGRDEFAAVVDDVVTEPAVGVPMDPFDDISLAETVVQTPPTPRLLTQAETGVTPVGRAIAQYGSLAVESDVQGSEPVSLYPSKHVAVVAAGDVLPDVESSVSYLGDRFRDGESTVFATGVSSTGDIGALVEGVHGPNTVHVLIIEDQ